MILIMLEEWLELGKTRFGRICGFQEVSLAASLVNLLSYISYKKIF